MLALLELFAPGTYRLAVTATMWKSYGFSCSGKYLEGFLVLYRDRIAQRFFCFISGTFELCQSHYCSTLHGEGPLENFTITMPIIGSFHYSMSTHCWILLGRVDHGLQFIAKRYSFTASSNNVDGDTPHWPVDQYAQWGEYALLRQSFAVIWTLK